jgi:lysozyme
MKLSASGLLFLKSLEDLRLKSYPDEGGVWTIGYGTTKNVVPDMEITEEKAEEFLIRDVRESEDCINQHVVAKLNQNQFDALVSFVFNVGINAFRQSTLLKKINCLKFDEVPAQMRRWIYVKNHINKGLINRRNFEINLFTESVVVKEAKKLVIKTNQVVNDVVVRTMFERIPLLAGLFKFIDGKKVLLGRLGLFATAILQAVIELYPDGPLGQSAVLALGALSWFLTEFGIRHKQDKELRGVE